MVPMSETCNHVSCSDDGTETVHFQEGGKAHLCEDHYHMNPDGSPVEDYEPNDPSKFTYENQSEL
jgi:hypothetical protein